MTLARVHYNMYMQQAEKSYISVHMHVCTTTIYYTHTHVRTCTHPCMRVCTDACTHTYTHDITLWQVRHFSYLTVNWDAWDAWLTAPNLLSDNYFVSPWPPIIISLPYDDPPPLVPDNLPIKTLVAKQLPTNTCIHSIMSHSDEVQGCRYMYSFA